jgi:TolB-like protein
MGEVYRARDTRLGRLVAIKVLRREVAADPDRIERFEREARAASALNHPNIVTIHDVGVEGQTPYLAMEWVDGSSLRNLVASGRPRPATEVANIGAQVADGLARAHVAGIVHRDLKPDNVMLTSDGLVKILDFGLAKLSTPAHEAASTAATVSGGTAAGVLLGTVGYMSPEQVVGRAVDFRSDQFALGLILYELATGARAFKRDSAPQTLAAIVEDEPEPLQARNPRVPPQLARIIARSLSKKPEDRYESTRDLARDLHDVVLDTSGSTRAVEPARRLPRASVAAIAAALVVVAGAAWWWATALRQAEAGADERRRVVAVLPFRDLTGDASRAYFAAGMTEEIRTQLVKVTALRLLSHGAVQRFGDAGVQRLRSELGAGTAVSGSVRLDGQRVRVAVELVDTETEQSLWSEQYDRTLEDALTVQGDVALRVAAALRTTLSSEERTRGARPPTANAEAYQLFLQARAFNSSNLEQNQRGIELLKKAVHIDPTFAEAQARLAYRLFFNSYYDDPKYIDLGIEAAQRAIEMDPTLATGYFALASAYGGKGWADKSRAAFLKAQELDPGDGGPVVNLAVLESEILGRHDEAIVWARRQLQVRPVGPGAFYHLCWPLVFLRDDATSDRWLSEGLRRSPSDARLQYLRATWLYLRGDEAGALAAARAIVEERPAFEEGLMAAAELSFLTRAPDAEQRIERIFRRSPGLETGNLLKQESHRTSYAWLLLKRGDRARAEALLSEALASAQAALENGNEHQRIPFEFAAIHATRGEREHALDWLEKTPPAGYNDSSTLGRHPIFEPLRSETRFQAVLATMERNLSAARNRSTVLAELRTLPFPAAPAQ